MTALLGLLAMSALIAWLVRQPSSELFEEADRYYAAAERWQRVASDPRESTGRASYALVSRAACLQTAADLTRKALRRMPWKCL
jgi:hypothetical protein